MGDGNPAGLGGGGWSGAAHPSKRPLSPATYGGQIGGRVTSTAIISARKENGVGLVHVGLGQLTMFASLDRFCGL